MPRPPLPRDSVQVISRDVGDEGRAEAYLSEESMEIEEQTAAKISLDDTTTL